MPITRRTFLGSSALALAGMATTGKVEGLPARPQNQNNPNRPTVVSSRNGLRGVAKAYELMLQQQADPLDAIIAGVNIQELDPEDQSVGYGGLPNADGVVQLDASCMHGPTKRAGSAISSQRQVGLLLRQLPPAPTSRNQPLGRSRAEHRKRTK